MRADVKPISKAAITPALMLEEVHKDLPEIDEVVIVAFDKQGNKTEYLCGSRATIALAAAVLANTAVNYKAPG